MSLFAAVQGFPGCGSSSYGGSVVSIEGGAGLLGGGDVMGRGPWTEDGLLFEPNGLLV